MRLPRGTRGLALLIATLSLAVASRLVAIDYHLDPTSGDDSRDGRSPTTAWRTLAKANAAVLVPGDRLLLRRGGDWTGQLAPRGSGAPGAPVTIGAYGEGPLPRIDGGGIDDAAVLVRNVEHVIIEDLEITNPATADSVRRIGLRVVHDAGEVARGIVIRRLWVHDVRGSNDFETGKTSGGIQVNAIAPFRRYEGVLVEDCVVHDVSRVGITINAAASNDRAPADGFGTGVVMRRNRIFRTGGDGSILRFADHLLAEHNVVYDFPLGGTNPSYTVGLWCRSTRHAVFRYNEVYGSRTATDGQGYDADIYAEDTLFEYNYSHGNRGGFMLLMGESWRPSIRTTIRRNVSVNDRGNLFTFSLGIPEGTRIHHNVFWIGPGLTTGILHRNRSDDATKRIDFHQNIVVNHGTGGWTSLAGLRASRNLYHGNLPASQPVEPDRIVADPGFVGPVSDAVGWATVLGFRLRPDSPAINRGVLLPGDSAADPLKVAIDDGSPDLGAFEFPARPTTWIAPDPTSGLRLRLPTTVRRTYRVEFSPSLAPAAWQALGAPLVGDGTERDVTLPLLSDPAVFYRIVTESDGG